MLDQIWFPLSITLWISAISSLLVLFSGVAIAYIFARRDFRGKELAELLVTLPLIIPPTVIGYLLVILVLLFQSMFTIHGFRIDLLIN